MPVIIHDDRGFTLVELLVAMVIIGIVVGGLAAVDVAILHNTGSTNATLIQSHDSQMAAAYFANDVQSADVSGTALSPWYGVYSPDTRCDQGNTPILRLAWTVYNSGGTVSAYDLVSYNLSSGSPRTLYRSSCTGASYSTLNSTPNNVVISSNVSATIAPTATVTASCPDGTAKSVVLALTEQPVPPLTTYVFQVSGARREATC